MENVGRGSVRERLLSSAGAEKGWRTRILTIKTYNKSRGLAPSFFVPSASAQLFVSVTIIFDTGHESFELDKE